MDTIGVVLGGMRSVKGLNKTSMVELRRIELLTSCMPCKRSTN